MYLTKLLLRDFGKFHNDELALQPGLNVIEGKENSGKSTIAEFISGIFYGIRKKSGEEAGEYERLKPRGQSRFSGTGYMRSGEKNYLIDRSFLTGAKKTSVLDVQSGREVKLKYPDTLSGTLIHMDKNTYRDTCVIHREEQEGGADITTFLENKLETGSGSVSKRKALEYLEAEKAKNDPRPLIRRLESLGEQIDAFEDVDAALAENKRAMRQLAEDLAIEAEKRKRESRKMVENEDGSVSYQEDEELERKIGLATEGQTSYGAMERPEDSEEAEKAEKELSKEQKKAKKKAEKEARKEAKRKAKEKALEGLEEGAEGAESEAGAEAGAAGTAGAETGAESGTAAEAETADKAAAEAERIAAAEAERLAEEARREAEKEAELEAELEAKKEAELLAEIEAETEKAKNRAADPGAAGGRKKSYAAGDYTDPEDSENAASAEPKKKKITDNFFVIILTGILVIGVIAAIVYLLPFEDAVRKLFIIFTALFVVITILTGFKDKGYFREEEESLPSEEDFNRVLEELQEEQDARAEAEVDMSFVKEYSEKKDALKAEEKVLLERKNQRDRLLKEQSQVFKKKSELEEEIASISLAIRLIESQSRKFREKAAATFVPSLSEYVAALTGNAYAAISFDARDGLVVEGYTGRKAVRELTPEEAGRVYLAIRLCMVKYAAQSDEERLPLVIDDVVDFASIQEAGVFINVLRDLGQEQIVVLTKNDMLRRALEAMQISANYVQLG